MGLCVFTAFIPSLFICVWSVQPGCRLQGWAQPSYSLEGDILIGGVIVVHSGFTLRELTLKEEPKQISCEGFNIRCIRYRDVLAMVFAIKEINETPELLPNITLGFRIFDSCTLESRAIGGILELLSGNMGLIPGYRCPSLPALLGIIGETMSSLTASMARVLGPLHFPQISHLSQLPSLSDKLQFPSFLRTVRSFAFQNKALAGLIGHFQWTWVGMIVSDDELGLQGGQDIKKHIEENGGCVAFMEQIHLRFSKEKILQLAEMIQEHSVKVIIVHSPEVHVKALLQTLYEQNVNSKVWIFTVAFIITRGLLPNHAWKIFNGSLGIAPYTQLMLDFERFLYDLHPSRYPDDIFIKQFWEEAFQCKFPKVNGTEREEQEGPQIPLKPCSREETLGKLASRVFELNDLSYTYQSYTAVYALAHALHNLMFCTPGEGPFTRDSCADSKDIQPWQILHYLKNVHFKTRTGDEIFFDKNGDGPVAYEILNVQISPTEDFQLVKVGKLDPTAGEGKDITINTGAILWSVGASQVPRSVCSENCPPGYRKAAREGKPTCCFDCVPCSLGEITNGTDNGKCLKCPDNEWPNERHDQCIEKEVEFLSYGEPLGLTLSFSSAFLMFLTTSVLCVFIRYRDTPIVKANNRDLSYFLLISLMLCFLCSFIFIGHPKKLTCMLRQTTFGILFSNSVSSVLAKSIIVVIAFKATNPNSSARKWLGSKTPFGIVFFSLLVQIGICVMWVVKSPPFPDLNMKSYNEKIIFECNEGDAIFFYCMLGYLGFLATVSFIVAFLSRNLPGTFNEAKLITFSMLVFVSVWISFIPAYLSTHGKYMVAVEVFAILCSSAGLLGCIFFPKCYTILLRPNRNKKEQLVRKSQFSNK
ncbi:extracellular calcium-sensing receptor-like [Pleurodeles waltl]|uniref:extracellular calcium-sensing receptor-like n=1 Tax=Pleurodeles waltl TaxID=8319 RepID=UPI003709640B